MKTVITNTYEEMSELCKQVIVSAILQDKRVNLSLTGGSTPKRMYELYIEALKKMPDVEHVYYYTFDETPVRNEKREVVGFDNLDGLKKMFFEPAGIAKDNIIAMNDDNYTHMPQMIEKAGGLDLMVIGMGEDGHFCANMPECVQYDKEVYQVHLTNEYPWNAPYQASLNGNFADCMYTLGLPSLLKARRLVLIVNGTKKSRAVKRALQGPLDAAFPSSYLKLHPNMTVILDREAAVLL